MSVGFAANKADIDNRAGSLAVTLRNTLADIRRFQTWLAATPDATLTGMGYSSAEVATLKSAFTDLDQLAQVYAGLATRTPAYDYQTFAKLVCGVI